MVKTEMKNFTRAIINMKKIIEIKQINEELIQLKNKILNTKKYLKIKALKEKLEQFKNNIKVTKKAIKIESLTKNLKELRINIKETKNIIKRNPENWEINKKILKKENEKKKKYPTQNQKLKIRVMNINGLSTDKYLDIEEQFYRTKEINIVCLTETHEKWEKSDVNKNIIAFNALRKKGEKKGGGIQILLPKMTRIEMNEIKNENKEFLEIEGTIFGTGIKIITVYFDANRDQKGKDRNTQLKELLEKRIEQNNKEGLMVVGDFNGHIHSIDGKDTDRNGKMIIEWMDKYELILLNTDEKCKGTFTRIRGNQKTTIDYVLVNKKIYENFVQMHIDEEKMIIDGSDHNLITVDLHIRNKNAMKKAKWQTYSFYTTNEEAIKKYIEELGTMWATTEKNLQDRLDDMTTKAETDLKRTKKRKIGGDEENKIAEKIWMTENIRIEIKKRKELNRQKRYGKTENETKQLTLKWQIQKAKVQKMIRETKGKYEIEMTKRLKEKNNRGKDLWKNIHELSGKDIKEKDEVEVNENGKRLNDKEAEKKIENQWKIQFKDGERTITPIHSKQWGEHSIQEITDLYKKEDEEKEKKGDKRWITHNKPQFNEKKWKEEIKKAKKGKAAGPNKLKNEIFIAMEKNTNCSKAMIKSFNKVINESTIPESWKKSRIKLIPKPLPRGKLRTERDYRPIALTPVTYRIMMSFIRKDVEEHLIINGIIKWNQVGFTDGGRAEYNHFALQYVVEKAFKKKEKLIVVVLDFKKAFDSIDRKKLIEVLIEYRINPYIIDLVAKIYSNEKTTICIGDMEKEIEINVGIKQGCTASTTFFKLITYVIMNSIENKGIEYEVEGIKLSTMFFADDSLALAKTEEATKKNLDLIIETSRRFGLEINKEKSNILIYNGDENVEKMEDIEVKKSIKYLGLEINNKRDIFETQKQLLIEKARKYQPLTHKVLLTSCNRMEIGKHYWKQEIMPRVLHGVGLMNMTKIEITELQTLENEVYRAILRARGHVAISALRGDIGSSLVESRFIQTRIMLVNSILKGKNELIKNILEKIRKDKMNPWNKKLKVYLKETEIKYEDIQDMSKNAIKKK